MIGIRWGNQTRCRGWRRLCGRSSDPSRNGRRRRRRGRGTLRHSTRSRRERHGMRISPRRRCILNSRVTRGRSGGRRPARSRLWLRGGWSQCDRTVGVMAGADLRGTGRRLRARGDYCVVVDACRRSHACVVRMANSQRWRAMARGTFDVPMTGTDVHDVVVKECDIDKGRCVWHQPPPMVVVECNSRAAGRKKVSLINDDPMINGNRHRFLIEPTANYRVRRQRRPANKFRPAPPTNPGWRPNTAGYPDPAIMGRDDPSPVVIGRPTPGFSAHPRPTVIRPYPPSLGIRPPFR